MQTTPQIYKVNETLDHLGCTHWMVSNRFKGFNQWRRIEQHLGIRTSKNLLYSLWDNHTDNPDIFL